MCAGTPTANQLFIQRPQIQRQDSAVASRPWSAPALQKRLRPLSAKKPPQRPTSAPQRRRKEVTACDAGASRTLDKTLSVEKIKRSRDPFKEFLSYDPVMEQLQMDRMTEESYIRDCKYDLQHKAILGKLDAAAVEQSNVELRLPRRNAKIGLPPVKPNGIKGLQKLQRDMVQSLKEVCENNQEAMGSFIEQQEEKRRQKQEQMNLDSTSGSLNELKNMLVLQRPETPKSKFVFADGGATPLRKRYLKHHDQYMLEQQDIEQAMQVYQSRRCKPSRKRTVG